MEWNEKQLESKKYKFAVQGQTVYIAYDLTAMDSDIAQSFLILEVVKKWISEHEDKGSKTTGIDTLVIPSTNIFDHKLQDSPWIVSHLRHSLAIGPKRYTN